MAIGFWARASLTFLLISYTAVFSTEAVQPKTVPPEQAWPVLQEGLQSDKASHRIPAVQALSLMTRDHRATEAALHALQDKDEHVREAAAVSLGQLRVYSAIPALTEALNDPQISVNLAAAHSLFLLKDKKAYDVYYAILMGDRKSTEGLLQSQLDRLKDPKQLAKIGFEEGIGFVPFGGMGYEAYRQIQSKGGDPVRAQAARFLAHDPDSVSEDALVQVALTDKSESVRLAALDSLAERGDPHCIDRLALNLSDSKNAVRYRTSATILHLQLGKAEHGGTRARKPRSVQKFHPN